MSRGNVWQLRDHPTPPSTLIEGSHHQAGGGRCQCGGPRRRAGRCVSSNAERHATRLTHRDIHRVQSPTPFGQAFAGRPVTGRRRAGRHSAAQPQSSAERAPRNWIFRACQVLRGRSIGFGNGMQARLAESRARCPASQPARRFFSSASSSVGRSEFLDIARLYEEPHGAATASWQPGLSSAVR
jgi:hypothetical protein